MRRVVIWLGGGAAALAVIFVFMWFRPDIGARVFFEASAAPVEITLRRAYDVPAADDQSAAITEAARNFLDSLDGGQRQEATFPFTDNVQRANWSNLPEGMVPRGGIRLGALSETQRARLDQLLAEFLSPYGVANIVYQLAAEDTLVSGSASGAMKYGSGLYYAAFLGEPSTTEPWMFQFGGHHLAINATVFGPHISFSPMLTGGEPLYLRFEGKDIHITQRETEAAQAFMNSLTAEQKEQTVRAERAVRLRLGPGKYGETIVPEGIKGSDLTMSQKRLLLDVIEARLGFINDDDFAAKMKIVEAGIEDTYFGWWGRQDVLGAAYFRVTAPSFVLEYAPRSGSGTVDHAHSMYREPANDYGSAWIAAE